MQNQTSAQAQEVKLIHSFQKNETEEVKVELRKFKGRYYLDIRVWFQSEQDNSLHPTKKGISLGVEHLSELRKSLDKVSKLTEKRQPEMVEV